MAQVTQAQKTKILRDVEIEIQADMYSRITSACLRKCTPETYPEVPRGDLLCMERCTEKFLIFHNQIGNKLAKHSMKDGDELDKDIIRSGMRYEC